MCFVPFRPPPLFSSVLLLYFVGLFTFYIFVATDVVARYFVHTQQFDCSGLCWRRWFVADVVVIAVAAAVVVIVLNIFKLLRLLFYYIQLECMLSTLFAFSVHTYRAIWLFVDVPGSRTRFLTFCSLFTMMCIQMMSYLKPNDSRRIFKSNEHSHLYVLLNHSH